MATTEPATPGHFEPPGPTPSPATNGHVGGPSAPHVTADADQLTLRYEHAKLANTHVDGQIQAAERKAAFLATFNGALFLLLASDLTPRLWLQATQDQLPPAWCLLCACLLVASGCFVASYVGLFMVFKARLEKEDFLKKGWLEPERPKELIYFGEVANTPRDEYLGRYAALTKQSAWEDLSFQVYKQALIAEIKYGWFIWAWKLSAVSGAAALVVTAATRILGWNLPK